MTTPLVLWLSFVVGCAAFAIGAWWRSAERRRADAQAKHAAQRAAADAYLYALDHVLRLLGYVHDAPPLVELTARDAVAFLHRQLWTGRLDIGNRRARGDVTSEWLRNYADNVVIGAHAEIPDRLRAAMRRRWKRPNKPR